MMCPYLQQCWLGIESLMHKAGLNVIITVDQMKIVGNRRKKKMYCKSYNEVEKNPF